MTYELQLHLGRRAAAALASALSALRRLPFSGPWLRLVGCAPLETAAPAACLVLLDVLPGALVAIGAGVLGHG